MSSRFSAAFVRQGWQVDLYARRFESEAPPSLRSVQQFRLQRVSKSLSTAQREQRLIELDRALALKLRQNGPYDLVYERHALWSAAGMEFAVDDGIPSILEVNAPLLKEQATYRELIAADRAHEIVQRSFQAAKTIVAVSGGVPTTSSLSRLKTPAMCTLSQRRKCCVVRIQRADREAALVGKTPWRTEDRSSWDSSGRCALGTECQPWAMPFGSSEKSTRQPGLLSLATVQRVTSCSRRWATTQRNIQRLPAKSPPRNSRRDGANGHRRRALSPSSTTSIFRR